MPKQAAAFGKRECAIPRAEVVEASASMTTNPALDRHNRRKVRRSELSTPSVGLPEAI